MTSGVVKGRDAQTRADVRVDRRLTVSGGHRSGGLILTHEMFSAKVERNTAQLWNSRAAATGLGAALSD
jgi:hypothetical protein